MSGVCLSALNTPQPAAAVSTTLLWTLESGLDWAVWALESQRLLLTAAEFSAAAVGVVAVVLIGIALTSINTVCTVYIYITQTRVVLVHLNGTLPTVVVLVQ